MGRFVGSAAGPGVGGRFLFRLGGLLGFFRGGFLLAGGGLLGGLALAFGQPLPVAI